MSEAGLMLSLLTMLTVSSVATVDIRPLLRQQGFYPLNGREKIKYVGHIPQGPNDYQIYVYRGVFPAAVVDHGVNSVIVILNGATFVGEYHVAMPTECKVRGQKVICGTGVIEFTKQGPPYKILFDGEVVEIEFGNRKK
jgi:hypothetical protein